MNFQLNSNMLWCPDIENLYLKTEVNSLNTLNWGQGFFHSGEAYIRAQ